MPQDTKSRPSDVESADNLELAPGFAHDNLQGCVPALATEDELRDALEKAFDYRGDVTITTKDGGTVEGYVFDRRRGAKSLADCVVRLIPKDTDDQVAIRYADIAR